MAGCDNQRFIPTYVGHTLSTSMITRAESVHPHIRGAYVVGRVKPSVISGSSPHTWGIPVQQLYDGWRKRFIPTYVGHTLPSLPHPSHRPVHPHIRGAYHPRVGTNRALYGSSPHTWGIQPLQIWNGQLNRFIPTYVGHTRSWSRRSGRSWFIPTYVGHTRPAAPVPGPARFIPTYVGHTYSRGNATRRNTVHPHIRGAYQVGAGHLLDAQRFIPTYVGHTLDRRKKNGWFQPLLL